MKSKHITAGEKAFKAASDTTKYDALEVGHALTNDIAKELMTCALRHEKIFDEDEYCVGYVIAGDPLIHNLMRRKFFAFLYLPSPRPNQSVFLYNKKLQRFTKRLWTLPNALTMAELSEMSVVDYTYREMKEWSDAFFKLKFWPFIRRQHNINLLSESEYLNAHREELIKASPQQLDTPPAQPFDFSKITVNQVVDPQEIIPNKDRFDMIR
jgi:hypothetical protein